MKVEFPNSLLNSLIKKCRNFESTEKFISITIDMVDHTLDNISKVETSNKKFDPVQYIERIILNFIFISTFGIR